MDESKPGKVNSNTPASPSSREGDEASLNDDLAPIKQDDSAYLQELHEGLEIIDSKTGLLTTLFAIILCLAIAWCFLGTFPVIIKSKAFLTTDKGGSRIVASASGVVDQVLVKVNDVVKPGDTLARIVEGTSTPSHPRYKFISASHHEMITEVSVGAGQLVHAGDVMFWGQYAAVLPKDSLVIAYVPLEAGKKVKKGDEVNIQVDTNDMFEFGMMKGKVIDVSQHAVSLEQVKNRALNQALAAYLAGGQDPLLEVVIKPNLDANTFSGYQWSSGRGPKATISAGTICQAKITVENISPIHYLFPR